MTPQQLAARQRRALLAAERRAQRELIRIYGLAYAELESEIADLQALIAQLRADFPDADPGSLAGFVARSAQLTALLEGMRRRLAEYVLDAAPVITSLQREHARQAVGDTYDLIVAGLGRKPRDRPDVTFEFGPPPAEVTARMIGNAGDGTPLGDLLGEIAGGTPGKVRDEILVGVARGEGPRRTARRIRETTGETRDRSLLIARTETLRVYREVSTETYKANAAVVTGWVWHCACDRRSCACCWAMHGTFHPVEETLASHPGCRCGMLPRTPSWADLGFPDIPDRRPSTPAGSDVFARLTADEQRAILGPGKYAAYRRGEIGLDDLVKDTNSERWGRGRCEASLREALAA